MARAGDVIENPRRKETVRFRQVAADNGGSLLEMWIEAEPTTAHPPLHAHTRQEERFEVIEGEVTLVLDGRHSTVNAGESMVIPAGTAHTWWNAGTSRLVMRAELEPALRFETFLETVYGLQRSGKTNAAGRPKLLQAAVLFDDYSAEWIPRFLPWPVRKILLPILAQAGRATGLQPWYPEYSPHGPVERVAQ